MFELEVIACHALMVAALLCRYPSTKASADARNIIGKLAVLGIINVANFVYSNWDFITGPVGEREPETCRISIGDLVTTTSMGTINTTTLLYIELLSFVVLTFIPSMIFFGLECWLECEEYYRAGYDAAVSESSKSQ